jgi:hemolysin III
MDPRHPPLSPEQRLKQEVASSVTHGVGALLSVAALVLLIVQAAKVGLTRGVVAASIFGAAMVLLYAFSALLHGLPEGKAKTVFDHLDLTGIFLMIAGTYTPFTLLALGGALGWTLFGVIWGLALLGTLSVLLFKQRFERAAAWIYLVMGWIIVFAIQPLGERLGFAGTALLAGGGLAYSVGVIFFLWHRFLYHHAIWHLFVMLGSFLHFLAVLLYVIPGAPGWLGLR